MKITQVKSKSNSVIDALVDALFVDNLNEIMDNYTQCELDFQTVVLFIKIYMMAYRITDDNTTDNRKQDIKDLIHYIMETPDIRSEIVKSFNNNTIIKTFFLKLKDH